MDFVSLFTGVGGFDRGFENIGMNCIRQVEIDKFANNILNKHWPNTERGKDVKEEGKSTIETTDLICGGFPCQDLSVAGKRAGLAGERSGLWNEYRRIISEVKPRWIVIENVPGLLSSWSGGTKPTRDLQEGEEWETVEESDLSIVLKGISELGYWWAYRVLDSQYFGVAQRRKRVFIIGHLTEPTYSAKVLFEPESCERDTPPSRSKRKEVAETIKRSTVDFGRTADRIRVNPEVSVTLQGEGGGMGAKTGLYSFGIKDVSGTLLSNYGTKHGLGNQEAFRGEHHIVVRTDQVNQNGKPWNNSGVANTLDGANGQAVLIQGKKSCLGQDLSTTAWQQNTRDEVRFIGGDGKIAGALVANAGMKQKNYVGVRRLTPLECERLQGFPDGWTEGESDTQRYKMMGNAVTVNVAEWIGKRIYKLDKTGKL